MAWFYLNEMPHRWYKWGFASSARNVRLYQKVRYDVEFDALLALYECESKEQEQLSQTSVIQELEKKYGKIAKHRRETFHFPDDIQEVISLLDAFFGQSGTENAKKWRRTNQKDRFTVSKPKPPPNGVESEPLNEYSAENNSQKEIEIIVDQKGNITVEMHGYAYNTKQTQRILTALGKKLGKRCHLPNELEELEMEIQWKKETINMMELAIKQKKQGIKNESITDEVDKRLSMWDEMKVKYDGSRSHPGEFLKIASIYGYY